MNRDIELVFRSYLIKAFTHEHYNVGEDVFFSLIVRHSFLSFKAFYIINRRNEWDLSILAGGGGGEGGVYNYQL